MLIWKNDEIDEFARWFGDSTAEMVEKADICKIVKLASCGYAGHAEFLRKVFLAGMDPAKIYFQVHTLPGGELWYLVAGVRLPNGDVDLSLLTEAYDADSAKQEFLSAIGRRTRQD